MTNDNPVEDGVRPVDLVLGGGGVRGVAHVGALATLSDRGYVVRRVAGASSGAMAGAMIAAGATPEEMKQILADLDWRAFTAADMVARMADAPLVGGLIERVSRGRTVDPLAWVERLLAERGVHTWADLRLKDPQPWVPENQRYRLVVRCLDVVHRRVVRLPWDYHRYGLDPDDQPVATAVRASMSVPLVFQPVPIGGRDDGGGLLIDGGLAAGFSVDILDRTDGQPPQHPTFALQLLQQDATPTWPTGDLALLRAVVETMILTGNDLRPVGMCDEARTIPLNTAHIRTLDVGITAEEEDGLFEIGATTMAAFLDGWDFADHAQRCR